MFLCWVKVVQMSVEFKSPVKLPGGGETKRCYYPFKVDTYGCGCSHNCTYCYARASLDFRELWDKDRPKVADVGEIKRYFESGKDALIKKHLPVRLGGMTDCFANDEDRLRVTEKVIEYLNSIDYPYLIITKNKLVQDYVDILNKDNCIVQLTITTEFDDLSGIYEEGASLTTERLAAGKKLAENGIYTAARINPLWPMAKDGFYTGGTKSKKKFRYFTFNLPQLIADHGFKTIIAGFLRLSSHNIKYIKEKTGEDVSWLFDKQRVENGAYHFSTDEIRYYYERIKGICDSNGVEFSVCYDSDRNYQAFRHLWANQNDCCNCEGKVKGFRTKFDQLNKDFIKGEQMENMDSIDVKAADMMPVSKLRMNTGQIEGLPKNPRVIKGERYEKLKKSLQDNPEMLKLRELVAVQYGGDHVVIMGNMRLKALRELGVKKVPVKVLPEGVPVEHLKAYVAKDNVEFGQWDMEMLKLDWDVDELQDWGG